MSNKSKGRLVAACMLQQSMFTFVGVGIGLGLGLQRRNLRPFVIAVTLGTVADAVYGSLIACRPVIDDFRKSVAAAESSSSSSASSSSSSSAAEK
jgi:hypothetical protein